MGRRGSGEARVSVGVLPGAVGRPQPGLTWATEHSGGSEAAEAANCPGSHHLEQERTKVEGASSRGSQAEDFSFRSLALARCPMYCLTKTAMARCRRFLNLALCSWLTGRKGHLLRGEEGRSGKRGTEFWIFQSGNRRAARKACEARGAGGKVEGSFLGRARPLIQSGPVARIQTLLAAGV